VSPPLRPLQTEHDEARYDRLDRIRVLTPWQAIEALRLLAGLAPEHVDTVLRCLPRACRRCGQMVPQDGQRPL
jgi:hypothetical protein